MKPEAASNVGWLLFLLRALRRREGLRIAGGSEGPPGFADDSLRIRVRERLMDGRLFLAGGVSLVRRGTGRPCNVCGRPIPNHETEHQVDHDPGEGRPVTFGLAHVGCYRLWREESRRLLPPPSPEDRPTR